MRYEFLLGEFDFHVRKRAGRAFRFCDPYVLEAGGRSPLTGLRLLGRFDHRRLVRKSSAFPQLEAVIERLEIVAAAPSTVGSLHRTGTVRLLEMPLRFQELLFPEKCTG